MTEDTRGATGQDSGSGSDEIGGWRRLVEAKKNGTALSLSAEEVARMLRDPEPTTDSKMAIPVLGACPINHADCPCARSTEAEEAAAHRAAFITAFEAFCNKWIGYAHTRSEVGALRTAWDKVRHRFEGR